MDEVISALEELTEELQKDQNASDYDDMITTCNELFVIFAKINRDEFSKSREKHLNKDRHESCRNSQGPDTKDEGEKSCLPNTSDKVPVILTHMLEEEQQQQHSHIPRITRNIKHNINSDAIGQQKHIRNPKSGNRRNSEAQKKKDDTNSALQQKQQNLMTSTEVQSKAKGSVRPNTRESAKALKQKDNVKPAPQQICKPSDNNAHNKKNGSLERAKIKENKEAQKQMDKINSTTEKQQSKRAAAEDNAQSKTDKRTSTDSNLSTGDATNSSFSKNTFRKRNRKGETPLHVACSSNKISVALQLLKSGANPNTKDNAGWTPLHEAVLHNQLELTRSLLQHGALLDVPGPNNETPLHEAARNNFVSIAMLLVKEGADIHARNAEGITPLQLTDDTLKAILQNIKATTDLSNILQGSLVQMETEYDTIFAYSSSKEHIKQLQSLVKKYNNIKFVLKFGNNVTHVIVDCAVREYCRADQDSLLTVASGKALVSAAWLQACSDKLVNIRDFEIASVGGDYHGVELSRMNRCRQLPGLFDGCSFYFLDLGLQYEISTCLSVNKTYLSQLVIAGGGQVLRRGPDAEALPERAPYHAKGILKNCGHFVIYRNLPEMAYKMSHLKSLPVGWLIDCVQQFKLIEPHYIP